MSNDLFKAPFWDGVRARKGLKSAIIPVLVVTVVVLVHFFVSIPLTKWFHTEGLGGGITTPSFIAENWALLLGVVFVGVSALFIGKFLRARHQKKKVEAQPQPTGKKGGETKKKKYGEFEYFPIALLLSFHWIGILSVLLLGSYGVYFVLFPIATNEWGMTELDLKLMACIVVGLPLLFHWINLVNGKKGRRPLAFTVGWIISVIGLVMVAILAIEAMFDVSIVFSVL
jgi:hypothetical protein